jgi:hypothetical protein
MYKSRLETIALGILKAALHWRVVFWVGVKYSNAILLLDLHRVTFSVSQRFLDLLFISHVLKDYLVKPNVYSGKKAFNKLG